MIRGLAGAAGMVALLFSGGTTAAQRQELPALTEEAFTRLESLPIDRMCSANGVYQYAFGSTELPPSLFNIPGMDKKELPETAMPFTTVALDSSKWSNRFYKATFEMPLREEDAPRAIERLAEHFRALGWIEVEGSEDPGGSMIDPDPGAGDFSFYSRPRTDKAGVRVALSYLFGAVIFECTDMALLHVHASETFGDLPPGTPRPTPPVTPPPAAMDPAICATPEGRAEIDMIVGNRTPNALMRYVGERNNYGDRLVAWKADRLEKSGKVPSDRMLSLMTSGLTAGSPKGNPFAGFEALNKMIDQVMVAADRSKAGDAVGECQAIVGTLKGLEEIDRVSNAQWRAMDKALDAEARRVGVSLE